MIIDKTYFVKGDLRIGQISSPEVQQKIEWYIETYEPEYLNIVLGSALYGDLKDAIQAAGTDPVPEPYYSLLNGADFAAAEGIGSLAQRHWVGLKDPRESPIAKYVYFFYNRGESTFLTGSGATVPKLENAMRVSVAPLQRYQWNKMISLNSDLFAYIRANQDDFPAWPYYSLGWGFPERRRKFPCGYLHGVESKLQNLFLPINDFNV